MPPAPIGHFIGSVGAAHLSHDLGGLHNMAKVQLIKGKSNVTPWGERITAGNTYTVVDPDRLAFFKGSKRYRVKDDGAAPPMRGARRRRQALAEAAVAPPAPVAAPPAPPAPSPSPAPAPEQPVAEVAAEAQPADAPLHLLSQSVEKLSKALATGEYDVWLDDLRAAERAGKSRRTAITAIDARRDK